jgi:hypothetical protein
LLKEAQEALDAEFEDRAEEIADCFLLVCDAARRYGMTWRGLIDTSHGKLEINKTRTYPKVTDMTAAVEHVRHEVPLDRAHITD